MLSLKRNTRQYLNNLRLNRFEKIILAVACLYLIYEVGMSVFAPYRPDEESSAKTETVSEGE